MKNYNIHGQFLVRSANASEWYDASQPGKGGNKILSKGEIGWEYGTSNFKIGNGSTPYKDLPYIKPVPTHVPYAFKLGTEEASYTYDDLKQILDTIAGGGASTLVNRVDNLETEVGNVKTQLSGLEGKQTQIYGTRQSFPAVGTPDKIYIDDSTGDAYYFSTTSVGYVKLTNSFDVIICGLGE